MPNADDIRRQIDERLAELEPLVAEYNKLRAMRGLTDAPDDRRYSAAERRRQVWDLALEFPGIRVKEVAERLNLSVPRIVQLVNDLESDGSVRRSDEGIRVTGELRP